MGEHNIPDDNWRYLGDGVYAGFDGYGVVLRANSHTKPTDEIYIEPSVYNALVDFSGFIKQLEDQYLSEFEVADKLSQHKDGLNFLQWLAERKGGAR